MSKATSKSKKENEGTSRPSAEQANDNAMIHNKNSSSPLPKRPLQHLSQQASLNYRIVATTSSAASHNVNANATKNEPLMLLLYDRKMKQQKEKKKRRNRERHKQERQKLQEKFQTKNDDNGDSSDDDYKKYLREKNKKYTSLNWYRKQKSVLSKLDRKQLLKQSLGAYDECRYTLVGCLELHSQGRATITTTTNSSRNKSDQSLFSNLAQLPTSLQREVISMLHVPSLPSYEKGEPTIIPGIYAEAFGICDDSTGRYCKTVAVLVIYPGCTITRGAVINATSCSFLPPLLHERYYQYMDNKKQQQQQQQQQQQRCDGNNGDQVTKTAVADSKQLPFHKYFNMEALVEFSLLPDFQMYQAKCYDGVIHIDKGGGHTLVGKIQKIPHEKGLADWAIHTANHSLSLIIPF